MNLLPHPASFISPGLTDLISKFSAEAEKLGRLHPAQLDLIYQQGWFKLFVPRQYGGLELGLPEALQVEEALAWADGSTGWTVTLCSGANWFIGFLQPEQAKNIFEDPKVCLAGSGHPSGTAKLIKNGYEINGYWSYATGAPHATIFTANCVIQKEGDPLVRPFWFKPEEVKVHENWKAIGMIATASHSFEVDRLEVPEDRCFFIDAAQAILSQSVYQFPFLQFAEATLAINSSGMSVRFLDLCKAFLDRPGIVQHLPRAEKKLNNARALFYLTVERAWDQLLLNRSIEPGLLEEVSNISRSLA